jgi:hypothetical protein
MPLLVLDKIDNTPMSARTQSFGPNSPASRNMPYRYFSTL